MRSTMQGLVEYVAYVSLGEFTNSGGHYVCQWSFAYHLRLPHDLENQ